ncbi:MEDS domain-containing protein [Alkalihalobacterium alkalicellulosilyticum]|uniref:MEDS domain-containing protein n=1 Tax=Alkalihalobacterium alkalicellulosilyticum TaxID=1912214 RepID=UPI0009985C5B|nr:MEDS domain-containing protein [Bacillus alkalicellulosilyticus]
MKSKTISLTKNIQINDGSHILYFYQDEEKYIDNVVSFIMLANTMNQRVVYIDNLTHYQSVLNKLKDLLHEEQINSIVQYVNNYDFYEMYGHFHFERILHNFKKTLQPYVDENLSVRIWGFVDWVEKPCSEELNNYEQHADISVNEIGYMTVCCYDGNKVSSVTQTEMLRSHEYFMTDKELVKSPLYNQLEETVFPSLTTQREIESEIDFYRQKLDFIHVVAHEVRNPLTVIKSFATILKSETNDPSMRERLGLIEDYSVAIDHEIHHIIETEQMLTSDTFWKHKLLKIITPIKEVLEIMEVKARTQNIYIEKTIHIPDSLLVKGNLMGYKLIISNLLSNAIKFSYEGGIVSFRCYTSDEFLIIEVIDHGIGIAPTQIDKLFQKYQKNDAAVPGQGIGLFMVNKLVSHFNGTISVESQPGKGTFIQVVFPI